MSNSLPTAAVKSAMSSSLSTEDEVWLSERLEEYREILDYLHEH